jgi:hypothetical protein
LLAVHARLPHGRGRDLWYRIRDALVGRWFDGAGALHRLHTITSAARTTYAKGLRNATLRGAPLMQ